MTGLIIAIVAVLGIAALVVFYLLLDKSQKSRRDSAGHGEARHLREGDGTVEETVTPDDR